MLGLHVCFACMLIVYLCSLVVLFACLNFVFPVLLVFVCWCFAAGFAGCVFAYVSFNSVLRFVLVVGFCLFRLLVCLFV